MLSTFNRSLIQPMRKRLIVSPFAGSQGSPFVPPPSVFVVGGAEYSFEGQRVHAFLDTGTTSVTFNLPVTISGISVAGGGGGGWSRWVSAGAGGAGGVVKFSSLTIPAGTYTVQVGSGGARLVSISGDATLGNNGGNTLTTIPDITTAIGGGGGGAQGQPGASGGSGGGGSGGGGSVAGSGTIGQGHDGCVGDGWRRGGWGGGAGSAATYINGWNFGQGQGVNSDIPGASSHGLPVRVGGGGGGAFSSLNGADVLTDTVDGGGRGSDSDNSTLVLPAEDGSPNTGGGGGGLYGYDTSFSGSGGSGMFVIWYSE